MRLSPIACRVLGALAEKRLTTPNQYPLSVAALQTACNQRSAREPVMDLSEVDVQAGLRELREHQLARTAALRGRVSKHEHQLQIQLDLDDAMQTVLGVLLLRGPQTVGEIRTRTERWHGFPTLEAVEQVLAQLAEHPFFPLAQELPREPGRREARWTHLIGDPDAEAPAAASSDDAPAEAVAPVATAGALTERVDALEEQVATLTDELTALRDAIAPILEELS